MSYLNTSVLQLQVPDAAGTPPASFSDRVSTDQAISASFSILDDFAADVTSSFSTTFCPVTGSVLDLSTGGTDLGAGFCGAEYNRGPARVIKEVVCFTSTSGSNPAGAARVDVLIQQGSAQPANFSSIFSNNAFKPAVSGSSANGPVSSKTFVSGTNMVWPAGTLLKAKVDDATGLQAGLNAMRGLTVQIFWTTTGSFGA